MDFFKLAQQTQEAYCVRHGIQVSRQFTDEELSPCHDGIAEAERELLGVMTTDERLGHLSPVEQAMLDEFSTKKLIPFRVSVTVPGHAPEQIGLIAAHACDAVDSEKPAGGLAIKVEALRRAEQQPCAAA